MMCFVSETKYFLLNENAALKKNDPIINVDMDQDSRNAYNEVVSKLDYHYVLVKKLLMVYQSPTSGLFSCGNEAYVRDSVYCAAALWALGLAYRRIDDDKGRCFELEHCTVKCMRGILMCYMKQAHKIEKFKTAQSNDNAIHCKYNFFTGDEIHGEYHHLQQDVVALFVLYLVQMTASGLQIIFNTDEVGFVQNLIYYLERSYRVPDYGMWGRGSKSNNGSTELHASSVGCAKAALESVNGFNLFGKEHGAPWSVLWVDMDAHNRNRTVVNNLLPKESISKNRDSAMIVATSYPFFAIEDDRLCRQTKESVKRKLEGKYGYKRFAGDGYMTIVEDKHRKYYQPAEIKLFSGIECEWPIFFIYQIIDGVFHDDWEKVKDYQEKLKPLLKDYKGQKVLVPRFYYVEKDNVESERSNPGTHSRLCSFGLFEEYPVFLWGQALFTISQLLVDNLISRQELDPIKRYVPVKEQRGVSMRYSTFQGVNCETTIQVVLIAESTNLQAKLSTFGIVTQTPHQLEPIQIWPSQELVKVYEHLGVLPGLGLSGRPNRPIGALGTSKVYRILGNTVVCYPLLFDISDFYMAFDAQILLDEIEHSLGFINKYWRMPGKPIFITLLREDVTRKERLGPILEMLSDFKRGEWKGIKIRLGKMQSFIATTVIEHLEFVRYGAKNLDPGMFKPFVDLEDKEEMRGPLQHTSSFSGWREIEPDEEMQQAKKVSNETSQDIVASLQQFRSVEAHAYLVGILIKREGMDYKTSRGTCFEHMNMIYRSAAYQKKWDLVRYAACLCKKIVDSLAPAITSILVKGRQISLGIFGHEEVVISNPLGPSEIQNILYSKCTFNNYEACLQQELVLHVGAAINDQEELFEGMLHVRIGWLIHAMKLQLAGRQKNKICEEAENIYCLSPSEIKELMIDVLNVSQDVHVNLSWLRRRQINGALNKVPKGFYGKVWSILLHCPEGFTINNNHLPQQPTIYDTGPLETMWFKLVEEKFYEIREPEYGYLMVETLVIIGTILERNPELNFQTCTDIDKVIQEAFDCFKKERGYNEKDKDQEYMTKFYDEPPASISRYISQSVVHTLLQGPIQESSSCVIA